MLEEVGDELVESPVVDDAAVVAEVGEHAAEGRVVVQALDVVADDADVVVVEHADDEGEDEEDPDEEEGHQEEDVVGGGAEDEGKEVDGVVEGDEGVGRVDPVVPAAELQFGELVVGDGVGVVW